jgi:hypothetical protein
MKSIFSAPAIFFTLLTVCGGCSDGNPFEYVPVSGQLTYEDGSLIPAGGMRLQFEPLDVTPIDGMYPRPASTGLDAEGRFAEVTSYKFGDGLMPGRHKVAIAYATDKAGKLLVPQSCTHLSTTPLVADTAELPLKILVPKP